MRRRRPQQLEMTLNTWGGRRKGAGRKRNGRRAKGAGRKRNGRRARVPHRKRPLLASRYPVHVTLRLRSDIGSLRNKERLRVLRRAFVGAQRQGFRITDWSVQRHHIHLIVEALDAAHLSRGVKGFSVRVAKGINKLLSRRGAVFADRYHARILRTPREVENALVYVIHNARRHGEMVRTDAPDLYSSGIWFDGWQRPIIIDSARDGPAPVGAPRTWLRRTGWRRHGLLALVMVPKGRRY